MSENEQPEDVTRLDQSEATIAELLLDMAERERTIAELRARIERLETTI
jgi:hypothetical protein